MKQSNLGRTFTHNWPTKVLSLLLAIGVFVVITSISTDTRIVEIPIEVILPSDYVPESTVADTIQLRITSESAYLALINPYEVKASADFSHVTKEGVVSVPVLLEADTRLFDIPVTFHPEPERLRIYFSRTRGGENSL
jgi:YbbR domain-containing protein